MINCNAGHKHAHYLCRQDCIAELTIRGRVKRKTNVPRHTFSTIKATTKRRLMTMTCWARKTYFVQQQFEATLPSDQHANHIITDIITNILPCNMPLPFSPRKPWEQGLTRRRLPLYILNNKNSKHSFTDMALVIRIQIVLLERNMYRKL